MKLEHTSLLKAARRCGVSFVPRSSCLQSQPRSATRCPTAPSCAQLACLVLGVAVALADDMEASLEPAAGALSTSTALKETPIVQRKLHSCSVQQACH